MRKILIVVQYDGTNFHGFQFQPGLRTVQGEFEEAAGRVLGESVRVAGAGRTDAGVHAFGQALTLETSGPIPIENLVKALNNALAADVKVVSVQEVPTSFNARRDAKVKLYSYRILNRQLPSPFINRYAWHVRQPLDEDRMQAAADTLVGEHDFAAFCGSGSSVKTTVRKLTRLDVLRDGEVVEIRAEGNGFLYLMVRIIVGTLVQVGSGRLSVEEVSWILAGCDRRQAGRTAPPQGLSLVRITY